MEEIILNVIRARNAVRQVEVVLAVMEKISPTKFDTAEFDKSITKLLNAGEIYQVDYVEYDTSFRLSRVKSLFFTKQTAILGRRIIDEKVFSAKEDMARKGKRYLQLARSATES